MNFSKKIILSTAGALMLTGSIGVYAGTIIERYKTPRGNIATVETESVHKNRIAVTVNGKKVSNETWYANSVTYVPLREVATLLGASVEYNSETMSADIVTESDLLNLLGLKIGVPYYGTIGGSQMQFKITHFDPKTSEFNGEYFWAPNTTPLVISGKISENTLWFSDKYLEDDYKLTYFGGTKEFKGDRVGKGTHKIEFKIE